MRKLIDFNVGNKQIFVDRLQRRPAWVGLLVVLSGLIVFALVVGSGQTRPGLNPANSRQTSQINLLQGHDWSDFAGATQTSHGVAIEPLGRNIVNQDGSGGQPNPPVNLAGPELIFRGDFILSVKMDGFRAGDAMQLYGGVPIIYDEWRYEPPSVQLLRNEEGLEVSLWDGNAAKPAAVQRFKIAQPILNNLQIERRGNQLIILTDGRVVGGFDATHILAAGKLWFGLDAGSRAWTLRSFLAQAISGSVYANDGLSWNRSAHSGVTLQGLAENHQHKPKIGAAVALNPLLTDNQYRNLALNQFSMWTTENELKPQFVHPGPTTYSFKEADMLVNTALRNNIAVHGHTLVFGEANPRWMQVASLASRQQIMTDHITTVMTHFKGRVKEWDVLDEPLSDEDEDYADGGDGLRHHIWYQAMGSSYVAIALRTAHAADPSAKLYINDYGLEADGDRWTALLQLVKNLQAQGVPLDGIGFEAHVYDAGDHIDPSVLEQHMEQLAHLGLVSRISEIDVHGDDPQLQAQEYAGVLQVCMHETSCTAFSTWGITDKYGSTTDTGVYPLSYGDDLLWDTNLQPKAAELQLMKLLGSNTT